MKHEEFEIWKDILGYEGFYQISNLGRVKTLGNNMFKNEKIMKNRLSPKGYLRIGLTKDNYKKMFFVHRLVAENFIKNFENKKQVNHINGIKTDNRTCNLEWNTAFENMKHASLNGFLNAKKGENHYLYKATDEIKSRIIEKRKDYTQRQLGKMFNLSQCSVSQILSKKIKDDKIVFDKENFVFYNNVNELADLYGICRKNLSRKLRGKRKNETNFIYA